jgi:predicted adenine nucleotide alpha hydrolase (AANH) superfamily ATPase
MKFLISDGAVNSPELCEERKLFDLAAERDTATARPGILIHSCCGPCSSAVAERLVQNYAVTLYFYNPNITDPVEYERRLAAQKSFVEQHNLLNDGPRRIALIVGPWDPLLFIERASGLEEAPEGGARCEHCFALRLEKTAEYAALNGFSRFGTTLSISPHKDYPCLTRIGADLALKYGITWHGENFKKQGGFQRSIALSKAYGLYRQNYCGCPWSKGA